MHIAICDDNIADRKHLERLLSRESDKRAGTPDILYVDSYGDCNQFFRNPFLYNLFFIDMVSTPTIAYEMVTKLRDMGVTAPVVLCSSKIDYTQLENLPPKVYHMQKPYTPAPLPELLAYGDIDVKGEVETISVHCSSSLKPIPAKDIFYFYTTKENQHMLCMKDGSLIEIDENAGELQILLESYHQYRRVTKTVIINLLLVTMLTPFTILMQDYKEFHYSPFLYRELKFAKEDLEEDQLIK